MLHGLNIYLFIYGKGQKYLRPKQYYEEKIVGREPPIRNLEGFHKKALDPNFKNLTYAEFEKWENELYLRK